MVAGNPVAMMMPPRKMSRHPVTMMVVIIVWLRLGCRLQAGRDHGADDTNQNDDYFFHSA